MLQEIAIHLVEVVNFVLELDGTAALDTKCDLNIIFHSLQGKCKENLCVLSLMHLFLNSTFICSIRHHLYLTITIEVF